MLPNDIVLENCEEVIDASTTRVAKPVTTTDDEGQQQQKEAFQAAQGG